ncbi:MAG: IS1595 family transposase [Methylocella sp.]
MLKEFKTLADLNIAFAKPQAAIDHFKAIRWQHGQFCPHCGHDKVYDLKRKNIYRCAQCKTNFSITVGTIFENSKLPLRVWFGAIWLITNHPKGIASTTLAKDLNITQKSAWFVLHRLRHAARTKSFNTPMAGEIEIDETYVGGKSINKHGRRSGVGGGHSEKTPVIGAVQRGGKTVARVLPVASQPEMHGFIHEVVSPNAKLVVTDAHPGYKNIGYRGHEVINHNRGEYVRGNAHTNSIESVWALLKRQITGTHHWISAKHMQKYVDEMSWRLNHRAITAPEWVNALFTYVEGRLTYKTLIA